MNKELKDSMMKEAMDNFVSKISENEGSVNGAKYKQDLDIEIQVRIDYLHDVFGKDEVEREISKYRKDSGGFSEDIVDEKIWNCIVSNLRGENI